MRLSIQKPDSIGAIASALCVVHCIITPFLFIAQSCSLHGCESAPTWWKSIDYIFLVISFFSIYQSTLTTSKKIMKHLLWSNWTLLFLLIINEKMQLFSISETITYIVAISLAGVHIYNLKYCQCENQKCCTTNG